MVNICWLLLLTCRGSVLGCLAVFITIRYTVSDSNSHMTNMGDIIYGSETSHHWLYLCQPARRPWARNTPQSCPQLPDLCSANVTGLGYSLALYYLLYLYSRLSTIFRCCIYISFIFFPGMKAYMLLHISIFYLYPGLQELQGVIHL